jgi:hypothetical protein
MPGAGVEKDTDLVRGSGVLGVGATVDRRAPGVGGLQADQHPHGGGLPGAVGAEEAGHHPGPDGEGQVVDDGLVAVSLGQSLYLDHDVLRWARRTLRLMGKSLVVERSRVVVRAQASRPTAAAAGTPDGSAQNAALLLQAQQSPLQPTHDARRRHRPYAETVVSDRARVWHRRPVLVDAAVSTALLLADLFAAPRMADVRAPSAPEALLIALTLAAIPMRNRRPCTRSC